MTNNKIGISIPWHYRTMNKKTLVLDDLVSLLIGIFNKQGLYLSNVYIREFPVFVFMHFSIFPNQPGQYFLISKILTCFAAITTLITKKNTQLACNVAPTIFFTPDIVGQNFKVQLFNDPLNIKKLIKKLLLTYATAIKQNKNSR